MHIDHFKRLLALLLPVFMLLNMAPALASTLPADGYISNAARTVGEMKTALETVRDVIAELPGGAAAQSLTISSGSITPANEGGAVIVVDTEGAAASDDLTNIVQTNTPDGRILIVTSADDGRDPTIKNAAGGAGQIFTGDGADVVLKTTKMYLVLRRSGTGWNEIARSYGDQVGDFRTYLGLGTAAVVNTGTGASNVPTITQADARYAALAGSASQVFSVNTPSTSNHATTKAYVDAALQLPALTQGRLTLETGVAFSTTDQLAKTTLYFTPHNGNKIALYNGSSSWDLISFSEISIAVPATTNTMYDVFVYNNSGTATLELTAWTNDTTRATALTTQDGILVKTGATTRKFVGCMRTTGVSGETEVSTKRKFVANYYNAKTTFLKATDPTNTWTENNASFHSANANTTVGEGRLEFITPWADQLVRCTHASKASNSNGSVAAAAGIGLDSTSTNSAQLIGSTIPDNVGRAQYFASHYSGYPAVGYHYLQALVAAPGGINHTFYGDNGGTVEQTGLLAEVLH
ncbi:MAG: hypothetical protein K2Y22_04220 [Candidatus Obscuribacterales bacterium]|nr:hypothetical protein [Candidatus Obscuribacterales bacterium]